MAATLELAPPPPRVLAVGDDAVEQLGGVVGISDFVGQPGQATFPLSSGEQFLVARTRRRQGTQDNPEDPNVAMGPDENLPWTDPQLIAAWWQTHGGDFQAGVGYVLGQQQSEGSYQRALVQGQQRQRIAAACGIARFRPTQVLFPTSAPAWRQKALLGEPAEFGR